MLILGLILFTNIVFCQAQIAPEVKDLVIANLCRALDENYVFPEKAGLVADYINLSNRDNKYDSINSQNEFARQLSKEIRAINSDIHIRIIYDQELERDILMFLSSSQNANTISEADIAEDEAKNFHFKKVEILPANIGYIELNGFAVPSKATSRTIFSALQFVAHTDAVILDLRNNFGGNAAVANEILSYFFSSKQLTGRSYNRIENKWTNEYVSNKSKLSKELTLSMPIYMLTSERTFSAAEGLAYNLQQLKNATVVGDTTRGGAHLTRSFSLGNGFVAFIPIARSENAITKTDWEGTGVFPNVATDEDSALYVAQLHLLDKKLLTLTSEEEKRKVNYVIHYLTSLRGIDPPEKNKADSFIGSYDYFIVSYEKNQLLFMDTKNHPEPVVMIPISDTLFQIGLDYQVEFIKDDQGKCSAIQMYWDDGWTEVIEKVK